MPTTLYLVRHGETDYNRDFIVQGRGVNSDLNATGRAQAAKLGQRFRHIGLDAIYVSPLRRTLQTADAIARYHPGVPLIPAEDLEEMSWGVLEGVSTSDATHQAFQYLYDAWNAGNFDVRIEGGESIREVEERALRVFHRIVEDHPGESVLLVTHGRFLRVLMASLLPEYGLARMHEIRHANTSVNRLVVEDGCTRAELLNCVAHLQSADALLVE